MVHHERDSLPSNDLSAPDEFAVPQDVTFLNSANIGPRLATGSRGREATWPCERSHDAQIRRA